MDYQKEVQELTFRMNSLTLQAAESYQESMVRPKEPQFKMGMFESNTNEDIFRSGE